LGALDKTAIADETDVMVEMVKTSKLLVTVNLLPMISQAQSVKMLRMAHQGDRLAVVNNPIVLNIPL
jgi:hypothetical protein